MSRGRLGVTPADWDWIQSTPTRRRRLRLQAKAPGPEPVPVADLADTYPTDPPLEAPPTPAPAPSGGLLLAIGVPVVLAAIWAAMELR